MPEAEQFASEQSFRALADATPQIVWTLVEGRIRYLNERGRKYFGINQRQIPTRWAPVVHPDDLAAVQAAWRAALDGDGIWEEQFRLKRHDDVYRWHLGRAVPVRGDDGEITHWCGTSTDIDDLKNVQKGLEDREQLFRTMADTAPVMIWMTDEANKRTYFNKGWLDFTGRTLEEEIEFKWSNGVHPDDIDRCLKIYHDAHDERKPFRMEYRLLRYDDVYRWVLDHGAPIFDRAGEFSGFIGSCLDIHERRQLEDQIRFLAEASPVLTSSLDYESTLQMVAQLVVPKLADWCAVDMLTPTGDTQLVAIAHINPEKVEFGRKLREIYPVEMDAPQGVGNVIKTGKSEIYPDIPEEMFEDSSLDESYLDILRSVGLRSVLIVPLRARGQTMGAITLVWAESGRRYSESDLRFAEELARRAAIVVDNARLYNDAQRAREELQKLNANLEARVDERTDELSTAIENLRDEVDERRHAQFEMSRLNRLLESRNRELQDFAHVASHDLQEPLRKILSFSALLRSEYGDALGDDNFYVERIQDAAERMFNLIRDLLEFSRVASSGEAFTNVDLSDVVAEVLIDLDFRIAETSGRVEAEELCTIEADPLQMRQLFQNLIGNGLKFHREGVPPVVKVRSRHDRSACVIEIEDNGIGFDETYLERIFSPFQRLHARAEYAGTGMGLAICRRIVERHGGTLTARSRPGHGSTFVARLPIKQPEN